MTPFSRRAVVAVAVACLVTGCGGGGGSADDGPAATATPGDRPSAAAGSPVSGPRPPARSVPVGLQIPAIGVDTPVVRLGLAPDRTVEVPPITADDPAGWYRYSPTPGRPGPSVILGHVTVGAHGDGVFRHLARLRRDDGITVRLENGTAARFAVTSVRTVAKADFPTEDVYGDTARPELRLITCGGPLEDGEYRDNVIVFAALRATAP
ncbi:class F sortase [Streptomyces althioticus]|uniref:class F sortase n=1 Tax=Actinomycetes TaxID=1760 RepID=UPI00052559F4|nr:class F sortase [Actinospica acidiphila]MBM4826783.1 class F sortase [Actinospica acidiphila]GGQ56038.1 class F sortase [Streptomyces althioticus]GGT40810.1 class F sortase [Streptomyces matensis]